MANHDLRCTVCGHVHRDVSIPISVGATAYCVTARCDRPRFHVPQEEFDPCGGLLEPIPAIGRMDASGCGFEPFCLPVEDPASPTGYRDVTVGNLADIRRLERQSEQAERNGEGRRMVWRDYSQDTSNTDVHTLGPDPSLKPSKTFSNGQPVIPRRGDPVIADHGSIED